jgi:ribosomal protein S18 acetylase RimI-like enzyme
MNVRAATTDDVPAIAELMSQYMQETFQCSWHGSARALREDGFGKHFHTLVAAQDIKVIGFCCWNACYDVHHTMPGGNIIDMYVLPAYRGRAVAVQLVAHAATDIAAKGGHFVQGQAVETGAGKRLYKRLAMSFPGTNCIVGGRAFRALTELAGRDARTICATLPPHEWNYEA